MVEQRSPTPHTGVRFVHLLPFQPYGDIPKRLKGPVLKTGRLCKQCRGPNPRISAIGGYAAIRIRCIRMHSSPKRQELPRLCKMITCPSLHWNCRFLLPVFCLRNSCWIAAGVFFCEIKKEKESLPAAPENRHLKKRPFCVNSPSRFSTCRQTPFRHSTLQRKSCLCAQFPHK